MHKHLIYLVLILRLQGKHKQVEKKVAHLALGVTLILTGFIKLPQSSFDKSEK